MTVRQMMNIPMHKLTSNQEKAFRELASSFYLQEIARPDCFSQANRRKYEVMYKKIAELDGPRRQEYMI